jgi:flavin reductase (DIM6/NTAB) family NADH-FMN oxidoreductase RutF
VIMQEDFDQSALRQAFACFPSGVTAFCGMVSGMPVGIAASSFTSVSLDPALVLVCVQKNSTTWPKLAGLDRFGLSVLASQHGTVARALASKNGDRFAQVKWMASGTGAVFVHGAILWLECSPYDVVEAGDHEIILLRVESLAMNPDIAPMVFHLSNFHRLASSA